MLKSAFKKKPFVMSLAFIIAGVLLSILFIVLIKNKFKDTLWVNSEYKEFLEHCDYMEQSGWFSYDTMNFDNSIFVSENQEQLLHDLDQSNINEGIKFSDYEIIKTNNDGENTINTCMQKYNGHYVSDAVITINTKNGELVDISGKYIQNDQFDNSINISTSDAIKIANEHSKESIDDSEQIDTEYFDSIYAKHGDKYEFSYILKSHYAGDTSILGDQTIIVSSVDGSIIDSYFDAFDAAMETVTMKGQDGNQTFEAFHEDSKYYLYDSKRHIVLVNLQGENKDFQQQNIIDELNNKFKNKEYWAYITDDGQKNEYLDKAGVDAFANLQRTYDFYLDVFNRKGPRNNKDELCITTNEYKGLLEYTNAFSRCGNWVSVTVGGIRKPISNYLDIMGHEYTHCVVYNECLVKITNAEGKEHELRTHDYQGINEGLADYFGDMVEDYSDDRNLNGTNNWKNEFREFNTYRLLSDYNKDTDEHDGAALVTRPIYLMHNGINGDEEKKIDNVKLTYMYYDLLKRFNSTNDFTTFRQRIEELMYKPGKNGKKYKLTSKQKDCVIDALDHVGIEPEYCDLKLLTDSGIEIYDTNKKLCKIVNFEVTDISGKTYAVKTDVKNGYVNLRQYNLEPGLYYFDVSIDESNNSYRYYIIINDDNLNSIYVKRYKSKGALFISDSHKIKKRKKTNTDNQGVGNNPLKWDDNYLEMMRDVLPYLDTNALFDDSITTIENLSDVEKMEAVFEALTWYASSIKCYPDDSSSWPPYYRYNNDDVIKMVSIFTGSKPTVNELENVAKGLCARSISQDEQVESFKVDKEQVSAIMAQAGGPECSIDKIDLHDDYVDVYYSIHWLGEDSGIPWVAHFIGGDGGLPKFEYAKRITDEGIGNSTSTTETIFNLPENNSCYSAYADLMEEYKSLGLEPFSVNNANDEVFYGYAIRDINSDGTPELILVGGEEWNGYELLRMYTYKDGKAIPIITDDSGKAIKYAFSGNKIRLWNSMLGSGIGCEAAYTFEPNADDLTVVAALSYCAMDPDKDPKYYRITAEDGIVGKASEKLYFCFDYKMPDDFHGHTITHEAYEKGIEGYDFTDLDFSVDKITSEEIEKVRNMK